jgi:hypothetical protein
LRALHERDAYLLVFSFADQERLRAWTTFFNRQFLEPTHAQRGLTPPGDVCGRTRFLADPSRTVYHAYGLGRNSVWRVYGPWILWQYVKWGLQGKPIRLNDDTLQRGGNLL